MRSLFFKLGILAAIFTVACPSFALARSSNAAIHSRNVCSPGENQLFVRCHARVLTDANGAPLASSGPNSKYFGAQALQSAYSLPSSTNGDGQVIGIVDAYDAPTAESDLQVYRQAYGLGGCTSASGCFRKVNQSGVVGKPPRANASWAQETSLDLDMASAVCPRCKILLVEASSARVGDLADAEDTAVRLGATVVSNSYGGAEFSSETTFDSHFNHPGVPITVSSGDSGYGVEYPAASRYVTAVGGTSLTYDSSTGARLEWAWSGAGSGCSAYEAKQLWQKDQGCTRRSVADVSAVADPATGVNVYDSTSYQGAKGWMVFGGTSVAAPVVAGVYALASNGASLNYGSALYGTSGSVYDITGGSNGSCSVSYLCNSILGYDGPTGVGTPNGVGRF